MSLLSALAKRRNRTRFSREGNIARDAKDWAAAAAAYRRHLALRPRDGRIWVQLGHVLKEAKQGQEAAWAYRQAVEVLPGDPDPLLHHAHALLAAGERDAGAERLRESAAAGGAQARRDLYEMFGEGQIDFTALGDPVSSRTLADLSREASGLVAVACRDVGVTREGIETLSRDPWIMFAWDGARITTPMALLTIEVASLDPGIRPVAQLYVDFGHGLSERESTRFSYTDGKAQVLLVDPARIERLRFDPDETPNRLTLPRITVTPLADLAAVERVVRADAPDDVDMDRLLDLLRNTFAGDKDKPGLPSHALALGFDLGHAINFSHDYAHWIAQNAAPSPADYRRMEAMAAELAIRPTFSFVMPTYNTPPVLLRECLDSLLAQTWTDFEICVADDNSPNPAVVEVLADYAARDPRVRYVKRPFNGHISAASNSALALATGDYIVLVDHDDLVPDYTLFVLAWYINRHPDADILYSDEDKVTTDGYRTQPYFKGEFNKYLLYGHNMVSHLGVYRRSLIEAVGGFRLGLEGSQDYDLLLRCFEQSGPERIVHIPHILYHWRMIPGSTAVSADQKGYAVVAAQSAINGHFERTGMPFRSVEGFAPGCTGIRPSRLFDTSVSIIIPTRNGLDLLKPCVDSILARDHAHTEILIVDNGSDDPETLTWFAEIGARDDVTILSDPGDFNFSRINNMAAEQAKGEILCFLNNDTEVVSADWLNRARAFLSQEEIGMVGARLLYPDGTLQHFGIALGMGEHRIAGIPHLGLEGSLPGYFGKARLLQEVSAVTAACMFVRRADFLAVGGFDEDLRVAYNDVDLCLKIGARGLRIIADPDITLIHKESHTRGSDKQGVRAKRLNEEAAWMRARWADVLDDDPHYSPNIDLGRVDFGYAARARKAWPWAESA